MKTLIFPLAIALISLSFACSNSDSDTPEQATARASARATLDEAISNAEALGVTDQTREYARQFCSPIRSLFEEYAEFEPEIAAAESSDDFEAFFEVLVLLLGPLEDFAEDLKDVDPPEDYEDYHSEFLEEIEFGLEGMRQIEDGDLFSTLLDEDPPTAEEPPELEAALAIECGDDFLEILESDVFSDFFGGDDEPDFEFEFGPTDEPPFTGPGGSRSNPVALGSSVETSDGQLVRVIDVDPDAAEVVLAENEFVDPPNTGNRMVLIEVEVTYEGDGDETLFVSGGQFSLTGSNNVVYDSFDDGVSCGFIEGRLDAELFSGGSAQGDVCFQYPENETDLILIVEPVFSFGSNSRRYLALD